MNFTYRKRALLAVAAILLLASLACMGSGNNGGNTGGDEGPDYPATEAALAATQEAMQQPTEVPPTEPPPPTEDTGGDSGDDTGGDTGGDFDPSSLQSGDAWYASDFDEGSDWPVGWVHFSIPSANTEYDAYQANGNFYLGLGQAQTTVYAVYDELYLPPEYSDVLVETYYDNVGDVRTNNVSIICRGSADGWYEFSLGSDGLWYIWKYDSTDGYTLMANGGVAGYNHNITDHVLSASCVGDSLTFYIDGVMPTNGQVSDRDFTEGQAGVSVSTFNLAGVEVEFDWFQIMVP